MRTHFEPPSFIVWIIKLLELFARMFKRRGGALSLALLLLFAVPVAIAQVVGNGVTIWGNSLAISTTTACVPREGSATCALFPAGAGAQHKARFIDIDSNVPFRFCWVGDGSLTIADYTVTDGSGEFGTGSGACIGTDNTTGGVYREQPLRAVFLAAQKAGNKTGLCPRPTTSEGDSLYAPCDNLPDATTDCASFGGGSCVTSPSQEQIDNAGVFGIVETISGTGVLNIHKRIEVK